MIVVLFFVLIFSLIGSIFNLHIITYLIFVSVLLIQYILINYGLGVFIDRLFFFDGLRLNLVILTIWVSLLIVYSRFKIYRYKEFIRYFSFFVYFLLFILLITFFSGRYLFFYFFFEVSLIPTLLIILGWGYQPERLQAGIYFLFYTLTASLPLLILIIYLYFNFGSLSFYYSIFIKGYSGRAGLYLILGLMGIIAFLVKLPIYFTHL